MLKRSILFFLSVCFLETILFARELVLAIMIKNEQDVIVQTLQPFVDAGVSRYLVLDTGSTDGTVETVKDFFRRYQIHDGYVVQEPFVDFATSRNYAIQCAEQIFTDDCYIVMIDAEWYAYNVEALLNFCHEQDNNDQMTFLMLLNTVGGNNFYQTRLFRAHCGIRFCGAVHEVLNHRSNEKVPDCYFVYNPSAKGSDKSRQRWFRDKDILLNAMKKNGNDSRSAFYLAQTYDCLQDLEGAYYWYHYRLGLPGWDEENFMTCYRLAQTCESMNNWDEAVRWYLHAYNMRPTRIEPLVKLAQYYWKNGQYALSYMFAVRATEIPYPKEDFLFVEKSFYDYVRYDVLGCAAWYLAEYEVGKQAVQKALEARPDMPHLLRNLQLYTKALE